MNTVKNFTTTHLRLNYIDVMEVLILLLTFLIKYVFQTKQKVYRNKNDSKIKKKRYIT